MAPFFALATILASLTTSVVAVANVRCAPVTGHTMAVSWTSDAADSAPMNVALMSAAGSESYIVAENVHPKANAVTVPLPDVLPGAYIISLLPVPSRFSRSPLPRAALAASPPFHLAARQAPSSSRSSTLPPLSRTASSLSASVSAAQSSISAAASSALASLSSAQSAAQSNLSTALSHSSSVAASLSSVLASQSGSGSGNAATAVRLVGPGVGVAIMAVLGGVLAGAALL
ncbi:hypothetical protein MIND_00928700 [Mycena indigotica]|uniref:Uncharacterized protein n=1 Tax=Mycena indigotica TaxID=2126181 RepID=A0A8H6SDX9_9AGAR|nr:uncharacterized protein MIND_00928700 [Mycena indigotica]KAF7296966.1 hypothetical protein MIND_00928700 [Mycena indigotica]